MIVPLLFLCNTKVIQSLESVPRKLLKIKNDKLHTGSKSVPSNLLGIPTAGFPSDHLPLCCDIRLNSQC